jgi:hypothetical protein
MKNLKKQIEKENFETIKKFKLKKYKENIFCNKQGEIFKINTKGKLIKKIPNIQKNGYLRIFINKKSEYVHRIIYQTFKGIIDHNMTIDHIDNNKQNNILSNLQILTRKENVKKYYSKLKQENPVLKRKSVFLVKDGYSYFFPSIFSAAKWLTGTTISVSQACDQRILKTYKGYRIYSIDKYLDNII